MELQFVLLLVVVVACLGILFFFGGGGRRGDKNCEEEQAEQHILKVPSYVTNVIFFSLYKSFSKALMPNTLKL